MENIKTIIELLKSLGPIGQVIIACGIAWIIYNKIKQDKESDCRDRKLHEKNEELQNVLMEKLEEQSKKPCNKYPDIHDSQLKTHGAIELLSQKMSQLQDVFNKTELNINNQFQGYSKEMAQIVTENKQQNKDLENSVNELTDRVVRIEHRINISPPKKKEHKYRCLVVDDDTAQTEYLSDSLDYYGIMTYTANNYTDAKAYIDRHASREFLIDFAIFDYKLNGYRRDENNNPMTGLHLYEYCLKNGYFKVNDLYRIIMYTGYNINTILKTHNYDIEKIRKLCFVEKNEINNKLKLKLIEWNLIQ